MREAVVKNRYLVALTFAPLERNTWSRVQIRKKSLLFDNFLVHGSLQQEGAAGGNTETGQMSSVETRQMSQQQSSVLSQQQTSVLSQHQASVPAQLETSILPQQRTLVLFILPWDEHDFDAFFYTRNAQTQLSMINENLLGARLSRAPCHASIVLHFVDLEPDQLSEM